MLIVLMLISWLMIANLYWNAPEYVRTLWVIDLPHFVEVMPQLIIECTGYILIIFTPFFALFITSAAVFFFINTRKGKIKYLEEILMKFIFYSIIISSFIFIAVFNIPLPPPQPSLILFFTYKSNKGLIQYYINWLSMIGVILISISIIGLHLMGNFNKKKRNRTAYFKNSMDKIMHSSFERHTLVLLKVAG
jgi:hypothetical protein